MSTLYLLRHAKAAASDPGGDRARRLEPRGAEAAQRMAQWMRDQRLAPDLVLCSTAARARETLDLVRPALAGDPEIGLEEELYLASAGQLLERLRAVPPATAGVLLVGHNPGLHELAALLPDVGTGPLARRLADGFPTAALAVYDVPVAWSGLGRRRARLVGFVAPKDLRRGLGS